MGAAAGKRAPTHFAEAVETDPGKVRLVQVFGLAALNGFPTLASVAISTATDSGSYSVDDLAAAIVFLNPSVTTLTPETATAVLAHVANTDALPGLQLAITAAGPNWNTPTPLVDMNGKPVLKSNGSQYCTYDLDPGVLNSTAPVSGQSKAAIYSDAISPNVDSRPHTLPTPTTRALMTTPNRNQTSKNRDLHFDLSHLGPAHESGSYHRAFAAAMRRRN